MLKVFKPRFTKPERGNPFYNTLSVGGYSTAIVGCPTDPDCNVLANCVGYAFGRFNEISNNTKMSYLLPRNAETFYDIALAQGLTVSMKPTIGSCMVWQKGETRDPSGKDGAGHVAIVEQVISDTEVITSESGYGCASPFWTQTRKKADGGWGAGGDWKFLGFIQHPDIDATTKIDTGGDTPVQPYLVMLTAGTPIYSITGKVVVQTGTITQTTKYTIVDEDVIDGTKYGKLKSGAGWVILGEEPVPTPPDTLKEGDTGDDVKKLQEKLISLGFMQTGGDDGVYGKITFSGVAGYQLKSGLKADGVCGPATMKSLGLV